jgi:site-specific recombinase XerD
VDQLPALVGPFVEECNRVRIRPCPGPERNAPYALEVRRPIEQMLQLVLPSLCKDHGPYEPSFFGQAAGFFESLRQERGLREPTVQLWRWHLQMFEQFLNKEGVEDMRHVLPDHLDRFIMGARARMCINAMSGLCSALRLLLRWLYREQRIPRDLSGCVNAPQAYRLSTIPRSVTWTDVERMLVAVNSATASGLRDYAMLILIILYGLRAREVAALTLDDIDWNAGRLYVGGRKAGHSTTYPLSPTAGEAVIAYLRKGRPPTTDRHLFMNAQAPRRAINHAVVSTRARYYLLKAGITVIRPGSHTLRHTCAQRLVDAGFPLKVIGDYLGHRAPSSTEIYTKVAVEVLRQVALGDVEACCERAHPAPDQPARRGHQSVPGLSSSPGTPL